MTAAGIFFVTVFSLLALIVCVLTKPPSAVSRDHSSRYPEYFPGASRPGRPSGYDYHRPGYPHPYDTYPTREKCRYGRPCEDGVDEGYGDEDYDDEDYDYQSGYFGCSCFLYVEYTIVFRRENNSQRFPCNRLGLGRCSRYCDNLFRDEGLRASSRQDACDVLGREIHTPWYRKNQVCGRGGPNEDIPLQSNLCCRRGRPSVVCSDDESE